MIQNGQFHFLFHANDSTTIKSEYSFFNTDSAKTINSQAESLKTNTFVTQPRGIKPVFMLRSEHFSIEPLVLLLLGISIFSLLFSKYLFPARFFQLIKSYTNDRWVNQLLREWNPIKSFPGPIFLLSYVFMFSLSLVLLRQYIFRDLSDSLTGFIPDIAILIFLFTISRLILKKIIALVFRSGVIHLHLLIIEYSHYLVALIVMLPTAFAMLFYPGKTTSMVSLISTGIVFVFSFTRTALFSLRAGSFSVFHLFLYLCALEIVPFLLLLKTVGMVFTGELSIVEVFS